MDCLRVGSGGVWWTGGATYEWPRGWITKQRMSVVPKTSRRTNVALCCSSNFLKRPAVFTAFRLNSDTLRIVGPGSNFITGIGNLVAVDEFFGHPFYEQDLVGPYHSSSLTYFLEENNKNDLKEGEVVKHGIKVLFQMPKKDAHGQYEESKHSKLLPQNSQVKDSGSVETLFLESGEDKGGANVRVVAGHFESFRTTSQQDLVLLDIVMRPGSVAHIPVYASYGVIVYILEGVGIFKRHPSSRPFYENEGHGIWFPQKDGEDSFLDVTCHMWSSLRFLVLEVLVT